MARIDDHFMETARSMKNTLILTSSSLGHTEQIGQHLRQVLQSLGRDASCYSIDQASPAMLAEASTIIIGARLRYGRYHPEVLRFIRQHRSQLTRCKTGFFSVSLTARKPEKRQLSQQRPLQKLLAMTQWQPEQLAIFAGKLDYPRCRWHQRLLIRLIMAITGGPTDLQTVRSFTDWQAVNDFARQMMATNGKNPGTGS